MPPPPPSASYEREILKELREIRETNVRFVTLFEQHVKSDEERFKAMLEETRSSNRSLLERIEEIEKQAEERSKETLVTTTRREQVVSVLVGLVKTLATLLVAVAGAYLIHRWGIAK